MDPQFWDWSIGRSPLNMRGNITCMSWYHCCFQTT